MDASLAGWRHRGTAATRLVVAALLLVTAAGPARAAEWSADSKASRVVVHAFRAGALRAFAHDHHFVAAAWRAAADLDPERLEAVRGEVTVAAGSLHDRQEKLSASDRAKVDRQVAGEVLEAGRFPEIRYTVTGFDPAPGAGSDPVRGTLHGTLALHGATRALDLPVEVKRDGGDRLTVRGRGSFRQSEFGIRPPRALLGTVSVKDGVEVEIELALVRRR